MDSLKRELRHVRFKTEDTSFRPRIQNVDSRFPRMNTNANNSDHGSQTTVPRSKRIVLGEPNANKQIVDKEIFILEQFYRVMIGIEGHGSRNNQMNSRSISRSSLHSNETRGFPLSSRNSNASTTRSMS